MRRIRAQPQRGTFHRLLASGHSLEFTPCRTLLTGSHLARHREPGSGVSNLAPRMPLRAFPYPRERARHSRSIGAPTFLTFLVSIIFCSAHAPKFWTRRNPLKVCALPDLPLTGLNR